MSITKKKKKKKRIPTPRKKKKEDWPEDGSILGGAVSRYSAFKNGSSRRQEKLKGEEECSRFQSLPVK